MKRTIRQARKNIGQIIEEYNKLSTSNESFFAMYHDVLLAQVHGAAESFDDMVYYFDNNKLEQAKEQYENIYKALLYCKAIIKLQTLTNKLPEQIYI